MRRRGRHRTGIARLRRARRQLRGFTLLETALAMVIVLVGVVAMVEAQRTFMRSNSWSSHEATASHLANELRERMRSLPRHDPTIGLSFGTGPSGPVLVGLGAEPGEVTVEDFDDIDDYNGITFGGGGQFDGPIDSFGRVIPEIDMDGEVVLDTNGVPVPLRGWSQSVEVVKVHPLNLTQELDWSTTEAAAPPFPGRNVDQYPLRVTVTVNYQGPLDPEPEAVTRLWWIVPAR